MATEYPISAVERQHIRRHFHALIRERAAEMKADEPPDLPDLDTVSDSAEVHEWFDVPGMYGGFAYWFDRGATALTLVSESWSRVVEGSGKRHAITAAGPILLAEGFV